jgi:hypothetical protein
MRIGRSFGLAILIFSTVVFIPSAGSTYAAGSCVTGGNYWAGYLGYSRPPANATEKPVGVSAYVLSKSGLTCGGAPPPGNHSGIFTTGWVMLFNSGATTDGHTGGLAQSGFMRARPTLSGTTCNYTFSEWHKYAGSGFGPDGERFILFAQPCTDGTVQAYRVTRISGGGPSGTTGPVQMTVGLGGPGTFILATTPFDINIWTAWTPFYSGETIYMESDMPGSASQRDEEYAMGIQSYSTGQFIPTPCYLNVYDNAPSRYDQTAVVGVCDHIWFWTK